jgi:hypothetical protein
VVEEGAEGQHHGAVQDDDGYLHHGLKHIHVPWNKIQSCKMAEILALKNGQ